MPHRVARPRANPLPLAHGSHNVDHQPAGSRSGVSSDSATNTSDTPRRCNRSSNSARSFTLLVSRSRFAMITAVSKLVRIIPRMPVSMARRRGVHSRLIRNRSAIHYHGAWAITMTLLDAVRSLGIMELSATSWIAIRPMQTQHLAVFTVALLLPFLDTALSEEFCAGPLRFWPDQQRFLENGIPIQDQILELQESRVFGNLG